MTRLTDDGNAVDLQTPVVHEPKQVNVDDHLGSISNMRRYVVFQTHSKNGVIHVFFESSSQLEYSAKPVRNEQGKHFARGPHVFSLPSSIRLGLPWGASRFGPCFALVRLYSRD